MSAASSELFTRRTPQLMSNPIAPGLITPRSASVATTPPTGRPYPWWMSGIASAALTIPGRVAPLASCSSAASLRMEAIRRSSATTRPGTRIPRPASRGIRQRYGPICSSCMAPGLAGGERRCAATFAGHARHGDDDAEHARELRHAVGAEPEAVEPECLDREATDRVEADIAEEERARAAGEARAEPGGEEPEHHEVPDRLVEEGRVEILVLAEAERAVWRRDVEPPRKIRRSAERLFVEEVPPASDRLAERDRGGRDVETAEDRKPPVVRQPRADEGTQDQPAVDREPALPDGDDLPWVPAVVIPVEENLVEPRSHEAREDRPLPAADDVVGRQVSRLA